MIPTESLLRWLIDFHLASAVLLAAALLAMRLLRQPAYRIAVAWAACGAIALAGVLYATPGWSSVSLLAARPEAPTPSAEAQLQPNQSLLLVEQVNPSPIAAPATSPTPAAAAVGTSGYRVNPSDAAVLLALCGATCVGTWLTIGGVSAQRLVAQGRVANEPLESIAREMWGAGARPRLLLHDRLESPVALNLLRPAVLLPVKLRGASREVLRPLLAHELAHVRNGDLWLLAALRTLMVVLWANPLFWLLRRAVRFNQEQLADAAAAGEGDRLAYAEQLVEWARSAAAPPRVAGAVGLWEGRSQVKRRVAALLNDKLPTLSRCGWPLRAACTFAAAMAALTISLVSVGPAQEAAQPDNAADVPEGGVSVVATGTLHSLQDPGHARGRPGEPNAIEVSCTGPSGDPVAEAEVSLYRFRADGNEAEMVGVLETDAEGQCRWAEVVPAEDVPEEPAGRGPIPLVYLMTVRAPGMASEESMMGARTIATRGQRFDLAMQKGAALSGTVVDEAGRPVAGARVSMGSPRVPGMDGIRSAGTDSRGRFAIDDLHAVDYAAQRQRQADQQAAALQAGEGVLFVESGQRLEVSHPDFAVGLAPIDRVPSRLHVTLQPTAVITGRVVDDEGRPVEQTRVLLQPHHESVGGRGAWPLISSAHCHAVVRTSADGRFECRELPPGAYTVRADLGNWEESLPPRIASAAVVVDAQSTERPNRTPDLLVTEGRVIEAQLVDAESGDSLRFEQPMQVAAHFVPSGARTFGIGVRQIDVSADGRLKVRITNEPGRLMLSQLTERGDWNSLPRWTPGESIEAPADSSGKPLTYPLMRRKLTVEEQVSEAMRIDLDGEHEEAIARLNALAEEQPNSYQVVCAKARLDQDAGRHADAIAGWGKVVAMPALPKYPALNNLAYLLASAPQQELRDGRRAIELSRQALAEIDELLPEERERGPLRDAVVSEMLDTLAVAYAEVGDFDQAVETQQKAIELANPRELPELRERLKLYQRREPYRMQP